MWDGTKLILRGLWMVRYMHVVIPRAATKKVMQKDISIQPTGKLKWNTKIYSNDQNLKIIYLYKALTINKFCRARSCCWWVSSEWMWRPKILKLN